MFTKSDAQAIIAHNIHEAYSHDDSTLVASQILIAHHHQGHQTSGVMFTVIKDMLIKAGGPRQWQCDNTFRMGVK